MELTCRRLAILLASMGVFGLVVIGIAFAIAGDDILDFAQTTALRIRLNLKEDELNQPIGVDETPIRFRVDDGDTASVIGQNLEASGLITDAKLFADYVQVEELDSQLEAATYFLNKTMNIKEIAAALTDSRFSQITFTIIPGRRIEEIAEAIDADPRFTFTGQDFLNVVGRGAQVDPAFAQTVGLPFGASLEGFLYPDTYSLPPDISPAALRDLLLQAFLDHVGQATITAADDAGYSLYEIVTLASIIEREAVHADEQPLISGVYHNRLDIGMNLEADPTVQYPIGEAGDWWKRITRADYQGVISEYNTYLNNGLPPGPIANPSASAINAAINPEPSDFLFFRGDCRSDGYHNFAVTFEDHLANGC